MCINYRANMTLYDIIGLYLSLWDSNVGMKFADCIRMFCDEIIMRKILEKKNKINSD